jgi:hypothetical protein
MSLRNLSESSFQRALSSVAPLRDVAFLVLDRARLAKPNKAQLARFAKTIERDLIGEHQDDDILLIAARVKR